MIGLKEDTLRGDCSTLPGNELELITQQAKAMNKKVGVVSTARITHATPAAAYARSVDRNFEAEVPEGCTEQVDIAQQVCGENTSKFATGGEALRLVSIIPSPSPPRCAPAVCRTDEHHRRVVFHTD